MLTWEPVNILLPSNSRRRKQTKAGEKCVWVKKEQGISDRRENSVFSVIAEPNSMVTVLITAYWKDSLNLSEVPLHNVCVLLVVLFTAIIKVWLSFTKACNHIPLGLESKHTWNKWSALSHKHTYIHSINSNIFHSSSFQPIVFSAEL